MNDLTNDRKLQHIGIITADEQSDRRMHYFERIRFKHRALPQVDFKRIDTRTTIMGKTLSFPLLISSMTGGDHKLLRRINRNLALAAEKTGVAMGVGSQRVMFTQPKAQASFRLRGHAPSALLFANLGAVQLNTGFGIDHARRAIEILEADALIFHLNPLQEAVQPEGDTDFSALAEKIGGVAEELDRPVILKEVGAGFSEKDAELAIQAGIRYIDVAGSGGTSWSRIEHHRHAENSEKAIGLTFQDWGLPTPVSLQLLQPYLGRLTLFASGGIRSGIDMAKALILGASLCGMASPFLRPAMESAEAVVQAIERIQLEFQTTLFLLGIAETAQLHLNNALLVE
ncbi:type 2 isopentenyl-diphosphate Delta-isomerase [candidate division KSB1 bacterium]|nr:type 2 isopentenyl-diphosphate Delta-isomerase [candidate division KSB1 bacterium]